MDRSEANKVFLTGEQKRFVFVYTVILGLCFLPFKETGQFVALIFIVLYLMISANRFAYFVKLIIFAFIYAIIGLMYYLVMDEFSFFNYWLFFVTISSILVLLADFRNIVTPGFLIVLGKIVAAFIFVEALYGIGQIWYAYQSWTSIDYSIGDYVRGTIDMEFDLIATGSNRIFALLISTLLCFLFAIKSGNKWILAIITGLLSFVLASVMHMIIFFIVSFFVALMVNPVLGMFGLSQNITSKIRQGGKWLGIVVILLIAVGCIILKPGKVGYITHYWDYFMVRDVSFLSGKSLAVYNTIFEVPHYENMQPLIGIGPGQYSSRASLIRSHEYFVRELPFPRYAGALMETYILSEWRLFFLRHGSGSTYFPFFSWLSLYGEMGLVGLVFILYIIVKGIRIFQTSNYPDFPNLNLFGVMMIIYLSLVGLQDNYWEWTQAFFPAMLNLSLLFAYVRKTSEGYK
jgi:hypothetical protein